MRVHVLKGAQGIHAIVIEPPRSLHLPPIVLLESDPGNLVGRAAEELAKLLPEPAMMQPTLL